MKRKICWRCGKANLLDSKSNLGQCPICKKWGLIPNYTPRKRRVSKENGKKRIESASPLG
jgi:DNA-directed RNA polymerase subunit RPC12/RpoP